MGKGEERRPGDLVVPCSQAARVREIEPDRRRGRDLLGVLLQSTSLTRGRSVVPLPLESVRSEPERRAEVPGEERAEAGQANGKRRATGRAGHPRSVARSGCLRSPAAVVHRPLRLVWSWIQVRKARHGRPRSTAGGTPPRSWATSSIVVTLASPRSLREFPAVPARPAQPHSTALSDLTLPACSSLTTTFSPPHSCLTSRSSVLDPGDQPETPLRRSSQVEHSLPTEACQKIGPLKRGGQTSQLPREKCGDCRGNSPWLGPDLVVLARTSIALDCRPADLPVAYPNEAVSRRERGTRSSGVSEPPRSFQEIAWLTMIASAMTKAPAKSAAATLFLRKMASARSVGVSQSNTR